MGTKQEHTQSHQTADAGTNWGTTATADGASSEPSCLINDCLPNRSVIGIPFSLKSRSIKTPSSIVGCGCYLWMSSLLHFQSCPFMVYAFSKSNRANASVPFVSSGVNTMRFGVRSRGVRSRGVGAQCERSQPLFLACDNIAPQQATYLSIQGTRWT